MAALLAMGAACDDPKPPPAAPPGNNSKFQETIGPQTLRLRLTRDGKAFEIKRAKLSVTWLSDHDASNPDVSKGAGERFEFSENVGTLTVEPLPGEIQVMRVREQEDLPLSNWRCKIRPKWPEKPTGTVEITLDLASEGIAFEVATIEKKPTPGVQVRLARMAKDHLPERTESMAYTVTLVADEHSRVQIMDVPAGRYEVLIEGESDREALCDRVGDLRFLSFEGLIEVTPSGTRWIRPPYVHELNRRVEVQLTEAGAPVSDVPVKSILEWWRIPNERTDSSRSSYEREGRTDKDGSWASIQLDGWLRVEIDHPRLGLLECYATVDGNQPKTVLKCPLPRSEELASIDGIVPKFAELPKEREGSKIGWGIVLVRHGDPRFDAEPTFSSTRIIGIREDGRFEIGNILAGSYNLELAPILEPTNGAGERFVDLRARYGRSVHVVLTKGERRPAEIK